MTTPKIEFIDVVSVETRWTFVVLALAIGAVVGIALVVGGLEFVGMRDGGGE